MATINVVVHGALGKMGQEVLRTVTNAEDMTPVGGADGRAEPGSLALPDGAGIVQVSNVLADMLENAHVVVDFSSAAGAMEVMRTTAAGKVNVVIGSTGLSQENYDEAESLANEHQVGIIIAPNFALGAVVMIHLAKEAASFFEYADLTEMHHEAKIDAPSGTAIATAERMAAASADWAPDPTTRVVMAGARGAAGPADIRIHSLRMRGAVADQEVVLGTDGQTLSIRHDTIDRGSFMPGVVLAVRRIAGIPGLTVGLDVLLGI